MMTDSGQVAAGFDCDAGGFGGGDCDGLSDPSLVWTIVPGAAGMWRITPNTEGRWTPLRTGPPIVLDKPPILFDDTPGPDGDTLSVGMPAHGWPEGWDLRDEKGIAIGPELGVYRVIMPITERGRRAAWVLEGAR